MDILAILGTVYLTRNRVFSPLSGQIMTWSQNFLHVLFECTHGASFFNNKAFLLYEGTTELEGKEEIRVRSVSECSYNFFRPHRLYQPVVFLYI